MVGVRRVSFEQQIVETELALEEARNRLLGLIRSDASEIEKGIVRQEIKSIEASLGAKKRDISMLRSNVQNRLQQTFVTNEM